MFPRRESGRAVHSNGFTSREVSEAGLQSSVSTWEGETAILVYLLTTTLAAKSTNRNRVWEQFARKTETLCKCGWMSGVLLRVSRVSVTYIFFLQSSHASSPVMPYFS